VYLFAVHTAHRLAGFANRKHIERANLRVSSFMNFHFALNHCPVFIPAQLGISVSFANVNEEGWSHQSGSILTVIVV
jgi:hypothetical protein